MRGPRPLAHLPRLEAHRNTVSKTSASYLAAAARGRSAPRDLWTPNRFRFFVCPLSPLPPSSPRYFLRNAAAACSDGSNPRGGGSKRSEWARPSSSPLPRGGIIRASAKAQERKGRASHGGGDSRLWIPDRESGAANGAIAVVSAYGWRRRPGEQKAANGCNVSLQKDRRDGWQRKRRRGNCRKANLGFTQAALPAP